MSPRAEQCVDVALLLLFLFAAFKALRNGRKRGEGARGVALATAALVVLAFVARSVLVVPTFLHANFRGAPLVDQILVFPQPAESLGHYGQLSFLVLGGIAKLFGSSLNTIATTNAVF